jgi:hypothetical protein
MAINSLEAIDILFEALKEILLDVAKPNGGVHKQKRPINSTKEDIVINSLPIDRNTGFQNGVLNVNIHVPNLSVTTGGVLDNTVPNLTRIKDLTKKVEAIIADVYADDWSYEVQQDNFFEEEKSSYNNVRVQFRALNI